MAAQPGTPPTPGMFVGIELVVIGWIVLAVSRLVYLHTAPVSVTEDGTDNVG